MARVMAILCCDTNSHCKRLWMSNKHLSKIKKCNQHLPHRVKYPSYLFFMQGLWLLRGVQEEAERCHRGRAGLRLGMARIQQADPETPDRHLLQPGKLLTLFYHQFKIPKHFQRHSTHS